MSSNVELGGSAEPHPEPATLPTQTAPQPSLDGPAAPAAPAAPAPLSPRWELRYRRAVVASDVCAVLTVVVIGHVLGLGYYSPLYGGTISPVLGLIVSGLVAGCLSVSRAWDQRVLGQGSEEFSRLTKGFVTAAVVLGLAGLALQLPAVRPWVFGLLPLAGLLCLAGRAALRKWLHHNRRNGRFVHPALVVGTAETVADLILRTRRDRHNGWAVRGACTPTGTGRNGAADILGVPVLGDLDAVADVVRGGGYRIVSVCSTPGWAPRRLHQLAWDIEGLNADLVVDPGLMEIAGPRLHVAPVDGFPMLRLTEPAFDGLSRVVKNVIDWLGAALLLLVVAPVLVAIMIAVKCDGGPVLFRQERVGRHGRTFRMVKFRSMVVDAEARKAELVARNEGSGPLFKLRDDPRVTTVGAVLRRYSLDELPQLFNVVAGSMSLIGPRPPLPEEVRTYGRDAERRLLVKPGMTGLWQVSGRSDLSWEESVRLDLRYVENWTLALDALILWKTIGTLLGRRGAY